MNLPAEQIDALPRTPGSRFAYGIGARPLTGYTIKRGVGRGGFGDVYYAVSDAGKEVALKLVRRNLEVELRGVTQCLNLKHPHLLSLYDVRHDDQDNCWVVMEYMAGDSLEDALQHSPDGLPTSEVLNWMQGIAAGVAYLHDRGLVHRDLKPGNIFNDEGVVKLGDYGLSKFISCSRRSGQTESIGTVHYMAPEIANGRYGREIDIYALGVILYEMLTGRVPFEGESVGEVLMKHLTAEPDVSSLPEPFKSVVRRALAKDPAVRFGTVEELIAALPGWGASSNYQSVHRFKPMREASTQFAASSMPPTAPVASKEPVWEWMTAGWKNLEHYWRRWPWPTPVKLSIAAIGLFLLLGLGVLPVLIPLVVVAPFAYLAYWITRGILRVCRRPLAHEQPIADRPQNAVTPVAVASERAVPGEATKKCPEAEACKPLRLRVAELLTSLLVAAAVAMVVGLVMVVVRGEPPEPEQFAWLALVSTLGAWGVLIPAKLWEGRNGEAVLRRFVMLIVGLALGGIAYSTDVLLWVDLPYELEMRPADDSHIPKNFYGASDGAPLVYAYLAYFGFLFLLVRWWRAADPARAARFSVWGVCAALLVAWMLNFAWPFPQPWGLMAAATISIAVQLASPWNNAATPPRYRTANNI